MLFSRKENSIRNFVWGLSYKVVYLVIPFFIRTLIIKFMGMDYLGLNNLFASILQIFNIAELGFGSAIVYNLYKPISENDTESICTLMGFYRKIYHVIGGVILLLGLFLMPFLPYIVQGEYPGDINIYVLYVLYLIGTVSGYFLFSYKSALLYAHQRDDILDRIRLCSTVFHYAFQIVVLVFIHNYYLYYAASILATLLNNLILGWKVKKKYPEYEPHGSLTVEQKGAIKEKVKGLMLYTLTGQTKNAFDSIIMSIYLGLTSVALYGNYYYIINNLSSLLSTFSTSVKAGVGNSLIIESDETNYKNFRLLTFIYGWITGICCVCLVWLFQPFMKLWVGEENCFPFSTVILLGIYFFLLTSCEIRNTYISAGGLWWQNRYRAIGSAVTNIVLNIILVNICGVNGIIIATTISTLIFDFAFTSYTLFRHCFKNKNIWSYFFWWLRHASAVVVATLISGITCNFFQLDGILAFILYGTICVLISNLIFILMYFQCSEFKETLSTLDGIIRKKILKY